MSRIALQVTSKDPANDALRLEEFVQVLRTVRRGLDEIQRVLVQDGPSVGYRVVGLSRSSPSHVELESERLIEGRDDGEFVFCQFMQATDLIQNQGVIPQDFDSTAVGAFRDIGKVVEQKLGGLLLSHNGTLMEVSGRLADSASFLLGPKQYAYGSVSGKLEKINIHNKENVFTVYPLLGPPRGIVCRFEADMEEQAIAGVGKQVEVAGLLVYNAIDAQPQEVKVRSIVVHRASEDHGTLKEFWDAPLDVLRGVPPEDFIRDIRDGEW